MIKYRENGSQRNGIIFFLMSLQKEFRSILNQYQNTDKFKTLFNQVIVELSKIHGSVKVNKNGQYIFKQDDINVLETKKQEILSNPTILKLLNYGLTTPTITSPQLVQPIENNKSDDEQETKYKDFIKTLTYHNGSIGAINGLFLKAPFNSIKLVFDKLGLNNLTSNFGVSEFAFFPPTIRDAKSLTYCIDIFNKKNVVSKTLENYRFIVNFLTRYEPELNKFVFRFGSIKIDATEKDRGDVAEIYPDVNGYSIYPVKKDTDFYNIKHWKSHNLMPEINYGISRTYKGTIASIEHSYETYLINNDVKEFIILLQQAGEKCIKSTGYIDKALNYKGSEEIYLPKEIVDVFIF